MPLQFQRVVEEMEIWGANSDGYSFTISFFENFAVTGFRGRSGYVASWSPLYRGCGAIKIMGSPFKSLGRGRIRLRGDAKTLDERQRGLVTDHAGAS